MTNRRIFSPEQKAEIVLESFQRDTTMRAVCLKYQLVTSLLVRWRREFRVRLPELFADKRNPAAKYIDYPPMPPSANYILTKILTGKSSSKVVADLAKLGFIVRDGQEFTGLGDSWIRINVRTDEDCQKLVDALIRTL